MRHGANARRSRNHRGNGHNNNNHGRRSPSQRVHTYDSNGPDVRIRGNAFQINEKYLTLARDAASAGDRVLAESYLQHAEHYQRIINELMPQQPEETAGEGGFDDQPPAFLNARGTTQEDSPSPGNESPAYLDGQASQADGQQPPRHEGSGRRHHNNHGGRHRHQGGGRQPYRGPRPDGNAPQPEASAPAQPPIPPTEPDAG